MGVVTRGERELSLRFESFPTLAHAKLEERITKLVDELQARAMAAAPHRTGRLRTEIKGRVFGDKPDRVAGYVQVYAPDVPNEYAKAATLEYGSNKPRRIFERAGSTLGKVRRRVVAKTAQVHAQAFRYLRGPFEEMRGEIESGLAEAIAEATRE